MTAADPSTREALRRLIMGFRPSHLIATAAELRLADQLADGPRAAADLRLTAVLPTGSPFSILEAVPS